jgi:hypothetical protein
MAPALEIADLQSKLDPNDLEGSLTAISDALGKLGEAFSIVDIEHLQIFSKKAISELLTRGGFSDVSAESFVNRYSLRYWVRLSPLPTGIKEFLGTLFSKPVFSRTRIGINVGNTIAIGFKK